MTTKIAVITGGSRGIGRSTALALAESGADIILTYLTKKEEAYHVVAEITGKGRKAVALQLDVTLPESFDDFSAGIKSVLRKEWDTNNFHYLVNNAGIGINSAFLETSEEDLDLLYKVHLKGPYLLSQKLVPIMPKGGRIINISTGLARFSLPGYSAYAAMKGAIEVLTRYMAKELGPLGITVNTIAPGAVETDFHGGAVRDQPDVNKYLASQTALGRVGLPDDIGRSIASLLQDDNAWITAQRIEVSGGMFL